MCTVRAPAPAQTYRPVFHSLSTGFSTGHPLIRSPVRRGPGVCGVVPSNPTAGVAPTAPTDGGMAVPGVQNGIYAGLWRVKFSSTGTWTLGNLRIDAFSNGIAPSV